MTDDESDTDGTATFADFDGYEGDEVTDGTTEHDAWGVRD